MKTCTKCKQEKSLLEFNKQPSKWKTDGYHHHCRQCKAEADHQRYTKDKEKIKQKARNYYENNREAVRENKRKYWKEKVKDLKFKLRHSLTSSIRYAYKSKSMRKNVKTSDILGCSYEYFVQHIESQFEPWMNGSNYGKCIPGESNIGWDIDHIIPLASAETEEDLIKLCHYTNLKPVCSNYNRYVKRDKLQN